MKKFHLLAYSFRQNYIFGVVFFFSYLGYFTSLIAQTNDVETGTIKFEIVNNVLVLKGLDVMTGGVNILDEKYNLVFKCNFDCVDEDVILDIPLDKTVHAVFNFYNSFHSNRYIGEIRKTFIPTEELPQIKVFKGRMELYTQSDVDNYGGYAVIERGFFLGNSPNNDIVDAKNLEELQLIGTNFFVQGTKLTDLSDLNQIRGFQYFVLASNTRMKTINAFNNYEQLVALVLRGNSALEKMNGFKNLKKLKIFELSFSGSYQHFTELNQVNTLETIEIRQNSNLRTFKGFDNLEMANDIRISTNPSLESVVFNNPLKGEFSQIIIENNRRLRQVEKIDAFSTNALRVIGNTSLSECCFLSNLVEITDNVTIMNNATNCNSTEEILQNCQSSTFACENVQTTTTTTEITISGLTSPHEIIKVFDKDYNTVFQCIDCEDTQSVEELPNGDYVVDIQLYDENWALICAEKRTVAIMGSNEPCNTADCQGDACENIRIATNDGELQLSNLTAPNVIAKIFDRNWQLISTCSGDCAEIITLTDLNAGRYHTDIQFYDENWRFICADKQTIELKDSVEPCDTIICQGDVLLKTQAEVDAFCGCTVIEGDLKIGSLSNNTFEADNDITSLAKLNQLRVVKGVLSIIKTPLTSLEGLRNLEEVRTSFAIVENPNLVNYQGLGELKKVGIFAAVRNLKLKNFEGIHNLMEIGSQLVLSSNPSLNSLQVFLPIVEVTALEINNNDSLYSLAGLDNLRSFRAAPANLSSGITIVRNERLTDITALENIVSEIGGLTIIDNPSLQDCCPIVHLIDEDVENGTINGSIGIGGNGNGFCTSPQEVLDNCQDKPSPSCTDITITKMSNQLTISNLNAPIEILKVFDANYNKLYECFADCDETIVVRDLPVGTYHLGINFYDENWRDICELIETIQIESDNATSRNQPLELSDVFLAPNPATDAVFLDLKQLEGTAVQLQLLNQFGQVVISKQLEKAPDTPIKIDLSNMQNGLYFIRLQAKGQRLVGKKLVINRLY